jgi:hypothetical protein
MVESYELYLKIYLRNAAKRLTPDDVLLAIEEYMQKHALSYAYAEVEDIEYED